MPMKKERHLEVSISNVVLILLYYLVVLIIAGVIKINILIDYIPSELVSTAKFQAMLVY